MKEREFSNIAKALADPRRVEILEFIAKQTGVHCSGVVDALDVGQSTVSHHIKILREAGLVGCEQDGQLSRLSVDQEMLKAYMGELNRRILNV